MDIVGSKNDIFDKQLAFARGECFAPIPALQGWRRSGTKNDRDERRGALHVIEQVFIILFARGISLASRKKLEKSMLKFGFGQSPLGFWRYAHVYHEVQTHACLFSHGAKHSPLASGCSCPKGGNQGGYGPCGPGTWFSAFFIMKKSRAEICQPRAQYFKVRRFRICNRFFDISSSDARLTALKFGHGRHREEKMSAMDAEVICMR